MADSRKMPTRISDCSKRSRIADICTPNGSAQRDSVQRDLVARELSKYFRKDQENGKSGIKKTENTYVYALIQAKSFGGRA